MKQKNNSGFSLIELAVVMVITGILLSGLIKAYMVYQEATLQERANVRMATIDQTLKDFYSKNRRLPCPAPIDSTTAGNDYDQESCSSNILTTSGTNSQTVVIGKFPAATLGLSNDFMRDVYGSYLTYAVTKNATTEGGATNGGITLKEENIDRAASSSTFGLLTLLEEHKNITYLVLSSGKTKKGAYDHNGQKTNACSVTAKDGQNCDGNSTFLLSLLSNPDDTNAPNFFDDRIIFKKDSDMSGSAVTLRRAIAGKDYDTLANNTIRIKAEGYLEAAGNFAVPGSISKEGEITNLPRSIFRLNSGDELSFQSSQNPISVNGEPLLQANRHGVEINPKIQAATQEDYFVMTQSGVSIPPNHTQMTRAGNANDGIATSGTASYTLWVKSK